MYLRLLFLCLFCFLVDSSRGQDGSFQNEASETKNTLSITLGTYLPFEIQASFTLTYERRLVRFSEPAAGTLWFRVGYGLWEGWAIGGNHFITGLTYLPFKGANHLELGLGFTSIFNRQSYDLQVANNNYVGYTFSKAEFRDHLPAATLGYRYQKIDGHFVFRTGITYPEGAYISLGAVF